ncbi:hypothetical protein SAMN05421505_101120 [Sinosporangium album]|uniref:SnoaL-like domain-containing protein n=1 Tax=Sinosporangium album TaxID=504805 RepID=A0A1G7QTM4_9ACTN|nr:hypothetical protein SAMN05421505_101120 [Sinosporangium album]
MSPSGEAGTRAYPCPPGGAAGERPAGGLLTLPPVGGQHDGITAIVDGVQAQFPGFVFTQVGEADAHHRQVRFRWGLGPEGAEPLVIGFDVLVLDESGRIQDVRGFLDKVPA